MHAHRPLHNLTLASLPSQASEVIFGDLWLFRVPVRADPAELLAMLGQPDGRGYELTVSNWSSAADLARELAAPLNITAHQLLVPVEPNPNLPSLVETSDQDSLDSLASSGEGRTTRSSTSETIDWTVASRAMQACMEQVVLIIRVGSSAGMARGGISSHQQQVHTRETSSEVSLSDALLSRLVGCVANSHIAAQVLHSRRGNVSVVLRGWGDDKIEAEWAEDDPDEFSISPLH